ncbi:MAG: heme ABC transporter permease [Alphaproteobacteria bacterium]|nr:heme ABC transporter permease [Alphaproteobacteria bacterium]
MHKYANPTQFIRIANAVLPWSTAIAVAAFVIGLPLALVFSPPDYQQGETVRIMYVHVPAAWMSLMVYMVIAGSSAAFLIWRHTVAHLIARASAPLGAMFAAVCLISGMLWGQPMWGTFWVWDARLTSVLILFFIYIGYIALLDAFDDPERGDRAAAILALVGSVNVPIIHFSVEWWSTLHQGTIITMDGLTLSGDMARPLLIMVAGFTAFYVSVVIIRLRAELLAAKIRNARQSLAAAE